MYDNIDANEIQTGDTVTVTLDDGTIISGPVTRITGSREAFIASEQITLIRSNGDLGHSIRSIDDWQPAAPPWQADESVTSVEDCEDRVWHRQPDGRWQVQQIAEDPWQRIQDWKRLVQLGPIRVYARKASS